MRRLLVCLVLALCVASSSRAEAQDPLPALQVYTKPIEPFAFQRDGKALGFSLDLWDRVAKEMGRPYEVHWVKTVSDLIDVLKARTADVGVAAISITSEREAVIDFSTPFYESGLGVLVKARDRGAFSIVAETLFTRTTLELVLVLVGVLIVIAHL